MDARVKPAHDESKIGADSITQRILIFKPSLAKNRNFFNLSLRYVCGQCRNV